MSGLCLDHPDCILDVQLGYQETPETTPLESDHPGSNPDDHQQTGSAAQPFIQIRFSPRLPQMLQTPPWTSRQPLPRSGWVSTHARSSGSHPRRPRYPRCLGYPEPLARMNTRRTISSGYIISSLEVVDLVGSSEFHSQHPGFPPMI